MKNTLTVEWPALPIGEPGWRTRLESLAERSEALIGKDCSLYKTAGLALELVGLMWPVIGSAETVAATCRASLLVGAPGIVAASSAANQLTEVHDRLDAIWEAAQNDPAAGRVELPPPVMNEVKPVPVELAAAVEPPAVIEVIEALVEPEPEPAVEPEPEDDDDELPPAWQSEPEPVPIEDDPEVVWLVAEELAAAMNVCRASVSKWNGKGLFAGLTRPPEAGEGKGQRFNLQRCRAAYEARPSRLNPTRPALTPLPVTIEPLPPAVEPSAPEPTTEAAADAAALLELAGGDEATLAALRELLACAPV